VQVLGGSIKDEEELGELGLSAVMSMIEGFAPKNSSGVLAAWSLNSAQPASKTCSCMFLSEYRQEAQGLTGVQLFKLFHITRDCSLRPLCGIIDICGSPRFGSMEKAP